MRSVQIRVDTRGPVRTATFVIALLGTGLLGTVLLGTVLLGAVLLVTVASAAPSRPAAATSTRAPSSDPRPPGSARPTSAPRTLEDITIQGEIDVPQVLFITGRPRPFYDDRLHRLYRPTTRQLLDAIVTPQVVVIRPSGPTREASR